MPSLAYQKNQGRVLKVFGFPNPAGLGKRQHPICAMTVAELAHGIYRANTLERWERRRQFVDELKTHIPVHPITQATAEIIAPVGREQVAKGIKSS